MIGMAASIALPPPPVPAAVAPPPSSAPVAQAHAPALNNRGTMIGVAIPGIAPVQAAPTAGPQSVGQNRTMMGVAIPGIAPMARGPGSPYVQPQRPLAPPPPPILPRPAPLVDDEPGVGPVPTLARRGVPLAYVAGAVFVIVALFGLTTAVLWKSHPLVVQPKLDAQGREQLHLQCETCKDGTMAQFDGAKAAFASKEADLTLTNPLKVGDNDITIHLDRPGLGRDEEVKAVVPIAYRVKADLSGLSGPHPQIVVKVQALAGTDVRVDDKPVSLDANGEGAYALDVSTLTTGWSDDLRLIDRSISYAIVPKGGTEQRGALAVRAGIATLHLDAPGPSAVIESTSFKVAGRTVKGGTVTANGQPVSVDAEGIFTRTYDATTLGDIPVELRADGPQLASRTARFTVKRVAHLEGEGKLRERAPWVGYDQIVKDLDGSIGKSTVVEGEVVDARSGGAGGGLSVAIVDDVRGCPADPCVVRVVYGGDDALARGDRVRAYGRVTRGVAAQPGAVAGASPVPEVQADFVVKGRGRAGAR